MRSRLCAIAMALGPGIAVRTSGCAVGGGAYAADEFDVFVATVAVFGASFENARALILQVARPSRLGRQFQRNARDLTIARCILIDTLGFCNECTLLLNCRINKAVVRLSGVCSHDHLPSVIGASTRRSRRHADGTPDPTCPQGAPAFRQTQMTT